MCICKVNGFVPMNPLLQGLPDISALLATQSVFISADSRHVDGLEAYQQQLSGTSRNLMNTCKAADFSIIDIAFSELLDIKARSAIRS